MGFTDTQNVQSQVDSIETNQISERVKSFLFLDKKMIDRYFHFSLHRTNLSDISEMGGLPPLYP